MSFLIHCRLHNPILVFYPVLIFEILRELLRVHHSIFLGLAMWLDVEYIALCLLAIVQIVIDYGQRLK